MSQPIDLNSAASQDAMRTAYVLNPSMRIIRSTDDEIVAQLGSRSRSTHRIEDVEGRGTLANFVEGFREPATPLDLAGDIGIDDTTLAEYMESLLAGKVLILPEQRRFSFLISGLNFGWRRDDVTVHVVGVGEIAVAVARQLTDLMGVPVAPQADLSEAFSGADIVVVAADKPCPGLFFDADEMSRATQTPWHLVFLDGIELLIGPTFVPNESANYYDFDTMDESARVMRMPYLYGKYTQPAIEATARPPLFVVELAASWTTLAIGQHLWGQRSFVEGYVMRVDLERMQIIRDRVLKLPRNPIQMGVQSDLRHPFL